MHPLLFLEHGLEKDQINDNTNSCENANDHIQTGDLLLKYFQQN